MHTTSGMIVETCENAAVLFARVAARRPDHPAVVYRSSAYGGERQALSYAELRARTLRLAALMREHGVGVGDRVALMFDPSVEMIVAILATLETGAAYVPLDPSLPRERLQYIVGHCAPSLLVGLRRLLAGAGLEPPSPTIAVDDEDVLAALRRDPPAAATAAVALNAELPMYVMYTSGTTGQPKGAGCTHRNVTARIALSASLDVRPDDVVVNTSNYAFDVSIMSFFGALLNGATLVMTPSRVALDFVALGELMKQERASWLFLTTALMRALSSSAPDTVVGLRRLVFGGEAASPAACRILFERMGPGKLVNIYGPTETGVYATWFCIDSLEDIADDVPIGYAADGTELYVVDETLRPVAEGELYIGGDAVGTGYLNNEPQTLRAFVTLDVGGVGRRFYKSGDLVRRAADGRLFFCGRRDDQVKINGFRIEPGEVQNRLEQHPDVKSAFVCVSTDGAARHLEAFVTPEDVPLPSLTAFLRAALPVYMIPRRIHRLPALPLTPNGKVDRRALFAVRAAAAPRRADGASDAAPADPAALLARRLVALMVPLLPASGEAIDEESDLEALGLSSIGRAMLLSSIRTELKMDASLEDMFAACHCRALAERLLAAAGAGAGDTRAGGARASGPPESAAQRRGAAGWRAAGVVLGACFSVALLLPMVALQRAFSIGRVGIAAWAAAAALGLLCGLASAALFAAALKWLIVGRYRPGRLERSSTMFWRHAVVEAVVGAAERLLSLFGGGTPLLPLWGRLLGARIGTGVIMESAQIGGADLVRIGPFAVIEADVALSGAAFHDGAVQAAPVEVGAGAVVRRRAALTPGSRLAAGAVRPPFATEGEELPTRPAPPPASAARRFTFGAAQLVSLVGVAVTLQLLSVPVALAALAVLAREGWLALAVLAPVLVAAQLCVNIVALAVPYRLLSAGLCDRSLPLFSAVHFRWWLAERVWRLAAMQAAPLIGSRFLPPVVRLYGGRVGRGCEIGITDGMTPALLVMGEDGFIGSESVIGGAVHSPGVLDLKRTTLGDNVFLGNEAFVEAGAAVPDDVLVGSMTRVASRDCAAGDVRIGVPSRRVAGRVAKRTLDPELFRPSARLAAARVLAEVFGLLLVPLPLLCAVATFAPLAAAGWLAAGAASIVAWPFLYLAAATAAGLSAVAVKWIVVGRHREGGRYTLWKDGFIYRRNAVEQVIALAAVLLAPLRGGPLYSLWWRLLGLRVGDGVLLFTAKLCEPDLLTVGRGTILAAEVRLQGHTFEERQLQHGPVVVGERTTLAWRCLALPGARVHAGAALLPLTAVMKGETLTGDVWSGSPARTAGRGDERWLVKPAPGEPLATPAVALAQLAAEPGAAAILEISATGVDDGLELRRLAVALRGRLRERDVIVRCGQRHLAMVLAGTDEGVARGIAARLLADLAESGAKVVEVYGAAAAAALIGAQADAGAMHDAAADSTAAAAATAVAAADHDSVGEPAVAAIAANAPSALPRHTGRG